MRRIKVVLLILGALIALLGIGFFQWRVQSTSAKKDTVQEHITADQAILDRMRDYRRQYLSVIEIIPVMIETAPEATSKIWHSAALLIVDRVNLMKLDACVAADRKTTIELSVYDACLKATHSGDYSAARHLRRKEDLYADRAEAYAHIRAYVYTFKGGNRQMDLDMAKLRRDGDNLQNGIYLFQSWQLFCAVFGVMIALGKDLVS